MSAFAAKEKLAAIIGVLQIDKLVLAVLNQNYHNNYIRCVNYHEIYHEDGENFLRQLKWYKKYFVNVSEMDFRSFLAGEKKFETKPGIMITFDDGLKGNSKVAQGMLEKFGFTGYFFVSPGLVGKTGYMTWEDLHNLRSKGHVIGCHTESHHRMNLSDTKDILSYEIIESKKHLEKEMSEKIDMFCWCGGEEEHYTKEAACMIREAGYKYAFMTNSFPITQQTNNFQIERSNVEASWNGSLIRFQINMSYYSENSASWQKNPSSIEHVTVHDCFGCKWGKDEKLIKSKIELRFYLKADEIMNEQVFPQKFYQKIIFPSAIRSFLRALRFCEYYCNKNRKGPFDWLKYLAWKKRYCHYGILTGFDIPYNTLGYGCRIAHCTSIVISGASQIGNYCCLNNNITIADANKKCVGDNVYIGSNVVIAKEVAIADGCMISACSFVNRSFAYENKLVGGVPAVVLKDCGRWTEWEPYKDEYDRCEKLRMEMGI